MRRRSSRRERSSILSFVSTSGQPIQRLYDATDTAGESRPDDSLPGEYPYTRGIHKTGYRGKPWTIRMFAGFGSAEETNERFRYLIESISSE